MIKMPNFIVAKILLLFALLYTGHSADLGDKPQYKMCVPHHILDACKELVSNKPSEYASVECVPARDRMECLEKVERREADFLAVDPEDMYVAYHLKNEDFSVFSEIRTVEEPDAEFRYEGIILVHKNSPIHSLSDLKGKKSCHTGYGRNVGYKIPITKLSKHGVLQLSTDPSLSPVERELKGLSELFTKSCLVGTYSPNSEVNQLLKKRYSNLCELCEDPVKCNYPDKYSGYDGAIRCLVENGGDVAFTKTIYIRRFFGLPINNRTPKTQAQANPDDYEYLCEDGSRKPITGPVCTWAQRPWQGYMSNSDVNVRISRLQDRINEFYNEGKKSDNKEAAAKLWINENNLVVKKDVQVYPGQHLVNAQYKDVIERDGSTQQKIRLCVKNDVELRKCETLSKAAYSRDIRPEFTCVLSSDCAHNVNENLSDVTVLTASQSSSAKLNQLKSLIYEVTNDHYVVVAKKDLKDDILKKKPIKYDANDEKSRNAALHFNYKRNLQPCTATTTDESSIQVVKTSQLKTLTSGDSHDVICLDLSRRSVSSSLEDLKDCYFDATPPTAVFVRNALSGLELDNIAHAFISVSKAFGKQGRIEDVFELFGEFEPGQSNVIFSDDAVELVLESNSVLELDDNSYKNIQC